MSIKKQFLKSKPVCKTTFRLTKEEVNGAAAISLVGEFNEWSPKTHPMKNLKSGDYTLTLELDQGKEYQFRYLIDGKKWKNDGDADKYVKTPYGNDNSVVIV